MDAPWYVKSARRRNRHMCIDREKAGAVVAGFFAGAFLGAGLALLFAPLSGREVREEIGEVVGKTRERVGRIVDEKVDAVKGAVAKVRGSAPVEPQGEKTT